MFPFRRRKPRPIRKAPRTNLHVEQLEDRSLPSAVQFGAAAFALNEGGGSAAITVTLDNPASMPVMLNYSVTGGTATPNSDYSLMSPGSLFFSPGEISATIPLMVFNDTLAEPDETIVLALSNPSNATLGTPSTTTVTILDDDTAGGGNPLPALSVSNVSQAEGNSGQTPITFTVSLSAGSNQPVSVSYATADGSATVADNDYQSASGILLFSPGETSRVVTVNAIGDARYESNETFSFNLSNPSNATIASGAGQGTIVNDDSPLSWVEPNPITWSQTMVPPPVVANPGNQSNAEGDTVALQISASDPNGYTLHYEALNLPTGLTINSSTGDISGAIGYQEAEEFGGINHTTVIVSDDHGGSASVSFTWVVSATVRPPVLAQPGNQSNAAGDAVALQVSATQPDGDPLFYEAAGLPYGLDIDYDTGLISGTLDASAMSDTPYSVTITVTDAIPDTPQTASRTFNWTVTLVAGTPSPLLENPGDQVNAAGESVDLWLSAIDLGGNALAYAANGLPAGLSLDTATGEISGILANSAASTTPYTVTVSAGAGQASSTETFTWTVGGVGMIEPDSQANLEGDTVSLAIVAWDASNSALTFGATGLPTGLSISTTTGLISGDIAAWTAAQGPFAVEVTAGDGVYSASKSFTWFVTLGVEQPPTLSSPGNQASTEGDVVSLQLSASDANLDSLRFSAMGLPDGLSINSLTGEIGGTVGQPPSSGSTSIVVVTADDGNGGTTSVSFQWSVQPASLNAEGKVITVTKGQDTYDVTVATFVSGDPSRRDADFMATVAWGDGASDAGLTIGSDGIFAVDASHTYTDVGNYTITVSISEIDGTPTTVTGTATVLAAPLSAIGEARLGAVSGQAQSFSLGSMVDGNPDAVPGDFTVTINWGDNSAGSGQLVAGDDGTFDVIGQHTYAIAGDYTASITIHDNDGPTAAITSEIVVAQVYVGVPANVTAAFADLDASANAGTFVASISWGDGTSSPGLVTGSNGSFTISASHSYLEDSYDQPNHAYAVTIGVIDGQGFTLSQNSSLIVTRPPITGTADDLIFTAGTALSGVNVATFTVPETTDNATEFAATIDWGDGSSLDTNAQIIGSNGVFHVLGSHTYALEDNYTIQVQVEQRWSSLQVGLFLLGAAEAEANPSSALKIGGRSLQANGSIVRYYVNFGRIVDVRTEPLDSGSWRILDANTAQEVNIEQARGYYHEVGDRHQVKGLWIDLRFPNDDSTHDYGVWLDNLKIGKKKISVESTFLYVDTADNAKAFFAKMDHEFFRADVEVRIAQSLNPAEVTDLNNRLLDLRKVYDQILNALKYERPGTEDKDQRESIDELIRSNADDLKDRINRLSTLQMQYVKEFFPGNGTGGINWDGFRKATELFNNFDLVNLAAAVSKIRAGGPPLIRTVRGGPDGSHAHSQWYMFAKFALVAAPVGDDNPMRAFWEKMKPILLEGTVITTTILNASLDAAGLPVASNAARLSAADIDFWRQFIESNTDQQNKVMFEWLLGVIARDKSARL